MIGRCVLQEGAGDYEARLSGGVRLADDTAAGVSPRETTQSSRVFGLRDAARDARPYTQLVRRDLALLAGGDGVGIGHRQTPATQDLRKSESRLDPGLLRSPA
jgi:hypothetical protein